MWSDCKLGCIIFEACYCLFMISFGIFHVLFTNPNTDRSALSKTQRSHLYNWILSQAGNLTQNKDYTQMENIND